jgi:hypothetical protein
MVQFRQKLVVPYARSRVFALMSDWTKSSKWDNNLTTSVRKPDQPTPDRVGTKFDCIFELSGKASDVDYTIIAFEEGKIAQFEGFTDRLRSCDTLRFADAPGNPRHTEVDANFDLTLRGFIRPLSFLMQGPMNSTCAVVMQKMETFIHEELEPKTF